MTTARDAQTRATMDLFAAFAETVLLPGNITSADYLVLAEVGAREALWRLTDITDPLAFDVLQAIHAERRRRMSAATREERRAG